MTLEDHLGDVLRKARKAAEVRLNAAANAASISEAAYGELEKSGNVPPTANLKALAPLLGLQPDKLSRIAGGWMPMPVDIGRWRELRPITTTRGGNTVN